MPLPLRREKCINCQEDINMARHIWCAVCKNEYHFCVPCFSVGAEIGTHKSDHDYHVIDDGMFSIFKPPERADTGQPVTQKGRKEWMGWEELGLLKAMEQYQYGNWKDVAAFLDTRTAEECEEHYVQSYIKGNLGEKTWGALPAESSPLGIIDHTIPVDTGRIVMDESDMTALPLANIPHEQAIKLGFLPRRQDFELEYNNHAEKLISNLQFDPTDDDLERHLKFLKVDAYYRQLTERNTRKRVALEYRLVDQFCGIQHPKMSLTAKSPQVLRKRWQNRESDLSKKLKPFSRLLNAKLMDILQPCLLQEEILRARLRELMRYKAMGLKTFDECLEHENRELPSTRKRSASVCEAGPSARVPKNPRVLASASKAYQPASPQYGSPKFRKASCSQKVVNGTTGVATRRQQPQRNLSAALSSGEPTSERAQRTRPTPSSSLRSSSRVVLSPEENGSVSPVSSSPSSSPSKLAGKRKKRKGKLKLTTKKMCTLKRQHVCPQHPAPPEYYSNA